MPILETTAHFHLDFMHERVGVANLFLDLAPFTKKRSELSSPPPHKSRLILALKMMPLPTGPFETRLGPGALSRCILPQDFLFDANNSAFEYTAFLFPCCFKSWHPAENLRKRGEEERFGGRRKNVNGVTFNLVTRFR